MKFEELKNANSAQRASLRGILNTLSASLKKPELYKNIVSTYFKKYTRRTLPIDPNVRLSEVYEEFKITKPMDTKQKNIYDTTLANLRLLENYIFTDNKDDNYLQNLSTLAISNSIKNDENGDRLKQLLDSAPSFVVFADNRAAAMANIPQSGAGGGAEIGRAHV